MASSRLARVLFLVLAVGASCALAEAVSGKLALSSLSLDALDEKLQASDYLLICLQRISCAAMFPPRLVHIV